MIFDSDALAPTYELQLGTPGASYALEISKRMGLSEDIINRSSELVGDGSVNLENILGQLEKERLVAESLRIDLENREKELEQIETQTFNKEKEINKAHKKAKNTALLEAEKIILSARREAENLIAEIRVNQADKKTIKKVKDQFQNTLENLQIQDKTAEEEFNSLSESDVQKGSIIYIPHLNSKGKIIHLPDKKNRVRVEVNGITLTLKLAELQRAEASESSESNSKPNISMNKTFSIAKIQIDLRGMRVDEALHETEKHLDSALISGMSFVHILHGKGTGALMEAIHEFLSEQSFVANFHFADEDQGGAGITVVEFE
jgi:DNA mismatch repair protein MutS2